MKCKKYENEIRCKVSLKADDKEYPIVISYQRWYCEKCGAKYYDLLEDDGTNMFDDRLRHTGYLVE